MQKTRQKSAVSLWQLFITFLKVGAFTFGGGYAMIAILEEELAGKKQWVTSDDMLNMVVIAESTPGVIAVNTATSVGYKLRGVLGAIVATLGVVLPSFCIIFGLSFAIHALSDNIWYQAAFTAIQACVTVLIINAFVKMFKQLNRDIFSYILMVAAFAVAVFTKFNVIFVILIGGVLGICYCLVKGAVLKDSTPLPLEDCQCLDPQDAAQPESTVGGCDEQAVAHEGTPRDSAENGPAATSDGNEGVTDAEYDNAQQDSVEQNSQLSGGKK